MTAAQTPRSRRTPLFAAVVRPVQAFLRLEAASGVVLLSCAVAALVLANTSAADAWRGLLGTPLELAAGPLRARFTVAALVNDGLMTIFFFVVGMEIKRELAVGELRTVRQAILPLIGAAGGMLLPAAIFLAFNWSGPGRAGWGIPMATDIAFCVGVLTLLRSRVPHALVVFVTALAIFDDIGGILVIALFYGHGLALPWLAAAAAVVAALVAMSRAHVRSGVAYAVAGALLWYALHHAGIHATIAGVIAGLAIPARSRSLPRTVLEDLARHAAALVRRSADEELDSAAILEVEERLEELEAPAQRFIHLLHPWVAFGVMPLFALANSGVDLRALDAAQLTGPVAVGIAVALLVGKSVGIFAFTWVAIRRGAPAPGAASPARLLGVATVAGIGFTVALFIAGLAFAHDPALLDQAKVGILAGSLVSGIVGAMVLKRTPREPVRARSDADLPLADAS
jgi:NhaA family Na+:H+ antiporter